MELELDEIERVVEVGPGVVVMAMLELVDDTVSIEELPLGHGYPASQSGLMRVTAPESGPPGGLACFVVKVLK